MKRFAARRFLITSVLFALFGLSLSEDIHAQNKAKIKFQADNIEYDESLGKKAKRLIGNVVFEHKGVLMYCDSAYQYPVSNSLDAFGRVHIKQGDSLNLYSDSLHYDGENQLFTCKQNVVLDNDNIHLTTDYLIYNRPFRLGYYLKGGTIVNREDQSELKSRRGYYYTDANEFYFKKEVRYVHPEFEIIADTLLYNTKSKKTTFLGPTDIYADSNKIHCEAGFFNSLTKLSEYHINAYIVSDSRIISGDSIFYNSNIGFGEILGHADIVDTAENIRVKGQHALLYENRDSAIVTVESELQQYMEDDTLFLHADTLKVFKVQSDNPDARMLLAYRHIRFFKSDLQGKCDSMVYNFSDSAIQLHFDPILWTGDNQITGDYIQLNMANGTIHTMDITKNAFVNSAVDSIRFNQIRGKQMTGMFKNNKLDNIHVTGNGQTVYYALDKDDKFVGVNRGESSDLIIKLVENEINQISYINDANATFFPIDELSTEELRLKGFNWRIELRPTKREDIFIWKE
ncbi:MAG TPA: hypothetical protein DCX54_12620 [Flavobacteriales bacterium]|nr:hypothetical protein [Flavobacteriales bacterium]